MKRLGEIFPAGALKTLGNSLSTGCPDSTRGRGLMGESPGVATSPAP